MRIFVYGTLRRGHPANELLQGCQYSGPAVVSGVLYEIDGRFPALTLGGSAPVHGEVWICPESVLPVLDAYEGLEEGLFRRTRIRVEGGACWVYVAGPLLEPDLSSTPVIVSGDWSVRRGAPEWVEPG